MISMSQQPQGIDYQALGENLAKAGIVTTKQLDDAVKSITSGQNVQMNDMTKKPASQYDEFMFHLKGGCGNHDCQIAREGNAMIRNGLIKGIDMGIKLGQAGAQRGVKYGK